jgi:hypothetical protein
MFKGTNLLMNDTPQKPNESLEELDEENPSLVREFLQLLRENKKYWLLPMLLVLLLMGVLFLLSNPAISPFIYTLF